MLLHLASNAKARCQEATPLFLDLQLYSMSATTTAAGQLASKALAIKRVTEMMKASSVPAAIGNDIVNNTFKQRIAGLMFDTKLIGDKSGALVITSNTGS